MSDLNLSARNERRTPANITDLTDAQVAELTGDDLDRIVRRMMAEQGVPIVPMPIEPDYDPVPGPDLSVYEVAGVMFAARDAAERVMDAINTSSSVKVLLRHDYSVGYRQAWVESDDGVASVTTMQVYSQQAWATNRATFERNETRKRDYDKAMSEYRKADNEAKDIRADVHDRHAQVMAHRARLDKLAVRFREYVAIADGDEFMALQFLRKVAEIDEADLPRVCGGHMPTPSIEKASES